MSIFTVRKRSLGQRNVCQASVILYTGEGDLHPGAWGVCIQGVWGVCIQRGSASSGIYIQGRFTSKGKAWPDTTSQSDTTGYGQGVGGTHPTGMHSC